MKQQEREVLSGQERLGLRVSAMINSPIAQLERRVLIHRLDTDEDQDWQAVIEVLADTAGLNMSTTADGSLLLAWGVSTEDDRVVDEQDVFSVQNPAPF